MDNSLGPISADQRVAERLLLPYLRPSMGVGLASSYYITLRTAKQIDSLDTCYIFDFPKFQSNVIDLRGVLIYIRGRLMRKKVDGGYEKMVAKEQAMLVNNSAHSLIESVTVHLGNNQESCHMPLYPHRAMLKRLLRDKNPHTTTGPLEGYSYDYQTAAGDLNSAIGRAGTYEKSKEVEFLARNSFDIFDLEGYLIANTAIRVTLNRSDPRFYMLVGPDAVDNNYVFDISEINLRIPVITLTDSLKPMIPDLISEAPARYYYTGITTKQFSLPKDASLHEIPRVFSDKIPQRCSIYI